MLDAPFSLKKCQLPTAVFVLFQFARNRPSA